MKEHLTAMRRDFDAGMTPRQIGERYGVSDGYVRCLLNRAKPRCVSQRRQQAARNGKSAEDVALLLQRGVPVRTLASHLGVSYGAVWQIGRRNGMRKLTDVKRERAKAMARRYADGITQRQIAAEFGVTQMCVSKAIRRVKRVEVVQ